MAQHFERRAGAAFRPTGRRPRESGGGQGRQFSHPFFDRLTASIEFQCELFPRRGSVRGSPDLLRGRRPRQPLLASQADAGAGVLYADHEGTRLSADTLGLNDLADPAVPDAGFDAQAPVVTHAIAPAPPSILDQARRRRRPERTAAASPSWSATMPAPRRADEETECLARAVYWESKGEPLAGQLSVAEVIINRARSGRFAALDLRRRPPARPILLRPRRLHPGRAAGLARLAHGGGDRPDRAPGPRRRRRAQRAVLPRPPRPSGLAPDPRRDGRQSRLLPLSAQGGSSLRSRFILGWRDGQPARVRPPASPMRRSIAQDVARGVTRLFFRGDMFALVRGAAAQWPPRRHDGDRRQGPADHRRDQGVARRPARRRQMARLSRLLRPLLLGGAGGIRPRAVRGDGFRPGLRRADRRRPLRCRDRPRGAAPAARRRAPQGRDAALRAPRRAPARRRSRSRASPGSTDSSAGRRPPAGPALPAGLLRASRRIGAARGSWRA